MNLLSTSHPAQPRLARSAFTLAEVLASLVFMAILIPVALEGLSIASRAGEVAARKTQAAFIADCLLNENVVTTNWNRVVQNGTIRQGNREFRWSLRSEPWNEDPYLTQMRLLTVVVQYSARGQDYDLRLSTLVNNESPWTQTNSLNNAVLNQ